MLPVREPNSLELRLPPHEVGSAKLDCPTFAANKTTLQSRVLLSLQNEMEKLQLRRL